MNNQRELEKIVPSHRIQCSHFLDILLNSLDEDAQNQIQGISMNLLKIFDW